PRVHSNRKGWRFCMSISVSKEFESITDFKQELAKYIECYKHERIKGKLKGMNPALY
ncbi:IS3 family transposase, partial [Bacillus toyonensis]|uniref:IS3 family transposase n=2 Tax=Bacillus toyonensis TaxID=155322 RepID=UPI001155F3B9